MRALHLRRWASAAALAVLSTLGACSSSNDPEPAPSDLSAAAKLGARIFDDPSLSASGALACSGCHQAQHAHASTAVVNLGGPALDQAGTRNSPTLRYLDQNPAFFFDGEGTPTGGFNRDGRASSLMAQAHRPFLAPNEMANASTADVVARLAAAAYADEFKALFGADVFADADTAFARALFALAAFQREDTAFHPYTSRYDDFLRGTGTLSEQERRGLALYNNPAKGNCAACHPSSRGADGSLPLFTDFTYDNLGVPRNPAIAANADPAFFDLGLCGPGREDLADRRDLCGAFKVPTLRNIAVTAPYFHNGRFATLTEAMRFYVRRDTHPEEWYPRRADGSIDQFDDLPDFARINVNLTEAPYNRRPGEAPALSESEIADVIAFLGTLTDADLR